MWPLLLSFLLLLTSCSGVKNETKEQLLRLNLSTDPPTIDSRKATDITSVNLILALFEGLMRVGFDNKPAPAIADKVSVSKDGLTYTFTLRDSLWSNGEAVTANDFLTTWEAILDPKFPAPMAYKFFIIKNGALVKLGKLPASDLGIKAPDPHTLIVTLVHPSPSFLELVASPLFFPVHKNSEESSLISNGPFTLENWDHDETIVLKKNPKYWDAKHVLLQEIEMVMIDDSTTEFHMFEMNELDWAGSPLSSLPIEVIPALQQEGKLNTQPLWAIYYYKLNTLSFPLQNQNIRKSLALAIDREAIVKHVLQGGERVALNISPALNKKYFRDHNIAEAKLLFDKGLAELGIAKENFPPLTLSFNSNREHQKVASAVQEQWREAFGIEVNLEHCDWKVYLDKLQAKDFQIARMGWIDDTEDPLAYLEPFKYKERGVLGNNNDTGWENQNFITLLDEAEWCIDAKKRLALLTEAEKILLDEMPIIPIFFQVGKYLKKPYVKDVYLSPGGSIDFKWAHIEK